MTLKIGLDVQFIKTETAGRDFRESRVVTVCSKSKEKGRLQFINNFKKDPIFKSNNKVVWVLSKNGFKRFK